MTPRTFSDRVIEKATRLVEENRVYLSRRHPNAAVVCGDTGCYEVWASVEGVHCECWHASGEQSWCSHVVAAMVAWQERELRPVTDVPFEPPGDLMGLLSERGL